MKSTDPERTFVDRLARFDPMPAFSIRGELIDMGPRAPKVRAANLVSYLEHRRKSVQLILADEAPGYRGCHVCGIPFTSERVLLGFLPEVEHGAIFPGAKTRATVWNAFPFHPYKAHSKHSNRKPSSAELKVTCGVLPEMRVLFPRSARVIAVRRVTERTLRKLEIEIEAAAVRHPAQGGATKFREQVSAVL